MFNAIKEKLKDLGNEVLGNEEVKEEEEKVTDFREVFDEEEGLELSFIDKWKIDNKDNLIHDRYRFSCLPLYNDLAEYMDSFLDEKIKRYAVELSFNLIKLEEKYTTPDFRRRINLACNELGIPYVYKLEFIEDKETKESQQVNPIKFDYDKMNINVVAAETKKTNKSMQEVIDEIDKLLEEPLNWANRDYQLMTNGLVMLQIYTKGAIVASFTIDPNMIHGNGYYILGTSSAGVPIFVPMCETKLLEKVVLGNKGKNYVLTEKEDEICLSHIFENPNIYNFVDFSGNKLKDISKDDYICLGSCLNKVLTKYVEDIQQEVRFRIRNYRGYNKFELVSDDKCISALSGTVVNTNNTIVKVDGEDMIITLPNGELKSLKIS